MSNSKNSDSAFIKAFRRSSQPNAKVAARAGTRNVLQSLVLDRDETETAHRIEAATEEPAAVPAPHVYFPPNAMTHEDVIISNGLGVAPGAIVVMPYAAPMVDEDVVGGGVEETDDLVAAAQAEMTSNHDQVVDAVDSFVARMDQVLAEDVDYIDDEDRGETVSDARQESEPAAVAGAISADAKAAEFEPAWEVDRLAWPKVCLELLETQRSYFDEAGRHLITATDEGLNVLAVMGSERGEGASTLSLCLAKCAAAAGVRVALIDADVDEPGVARSLNLQLPNGWDESICEGLPAHESAVASVEDNVCLFPLSPSSREAPMILHDPAVSRFLRAAAENFDLLIVDGGPISGEDCRLFEQGDQCPIDAAIVVRDSRRTNDHQLDAAINKLHASGVAAVGVAENFATDAA